jgi:SAM-dependent methyltransferase
VYENSIREEFTHQSASFGKAAVMTSAVTLGALVELAPEDASARWLESACGTGLVSRALAGRVGSVVGVDLTPAMLEQAERGAVAEGVENASFSAGDATALEFADGSFDGAVTRFSLHHIPVPGRAIAELARVVRPGGWVVVSDLVGDEGDGEGAAWREEIERLRDPSHWACRTPEQLREMGAEAGLSLDREQLISYELDFDEWLARGSGGRAAAPLVDELLAQRPEGAKSFRVTAGESGRRLQQRYWMARWRRPA